MTSLDALVDEGLVRRAVPVAPSTTYKLGGPADFYAEVETEEMLSMVGGAAGELPVLVLGRGSNLVVSDRGFRGLIVRLGAGFVWTDFGPADELAAGGATPMPSIARSCGRAGRAGLEFLVGIPGSIGGGVKMNAGCHGSEVKDRLVSARVLELRSGAVSVRTPDTLDFAYRHSNLTGDEVVTAARFRVEKEPPAQIEARMREIVRWRREHQPGGSLNAGSVFRNPPGDSAGRLIDSLGLKGVRIGGASVSTKHANFFVADAGATAQDVYDLVGAIRSKVQAETGIRLDTEIQFAGPFEAAP